MLLSLCFPLTNSTIFFGRILVTIFSHHFVGMRKVSLLREKKKQWSFSLLLTFISREKKRSFSFCKYMFVKNWRQLRNAKKKKTKNKNKKNITQVWRHKYIINLYISRFIIIFVNVLIVVMFFCLFYHDFLLSSILIKSWCLFRNNS